MPTFCQYCRASLSEAQTTSSGKSYCGRCGNRFSAHGKGTTVGDLGIHPMLARKYDGTQRALQTQMAKAGGMSRPLGAKGQSEEQRSTESSRQNKMVRRALAGQPKVNAIPGPFGATRFTRFGINPRLEEAQPKPPEIPGYELFECIGRGAMGHVYRARHIESGKEAAIKILLSGLSERKDLVFRFEREVAALKAFTHKNIVGIYGSGVYLEQHYYAMEFIRGTTLRKCLKHEPLTPIAAIYVARSILHGLEAAHERGIIHRDLKPENVLIESFRFGQPVERSRVVLVDFGLVGIANGSVDPHPNLTRSRVTMGTLNYMAPEQHMDAKHVDQRTDLYSVGVMLYECLTLELPMGRFALLSERGIDVPKALDSCLVRALSTDVKDRYKTAREMNDALKRIAMEMEARRGSQLTLSFEKKQGVQKISAPPHEATEPAQANLTQILAERLGFAAWPLKRWFLGAGIATLLLALFRFARF
jgi:serine/threonine protein kinase